MHRSLRFTWLFCALMVMLLSYPFFGDDATGAALGGLISLLVLGAGVHAVRSCRVTGLDTSTS